jgi:NADP-dependent 3-hydroxy acid dehydrogenase YdfG
MTEKMVVITGASSGIGAALAVGLTKIGMKVVLVARRADALAKVAAKCSGSSHVVVADMTRREDAKRVIGESLAHYGRIDVWVNNVGQGITRRPTQITDEDIDEMMRVNVKSALYGMQEVLPHFISRNEGHIINVSSMLGRTPWATTRAAYSGAKHYRPSGWDC